MSLGSAQNVNFFSGSGKPQSGMPDPHDLSWLGIHNPPSTGQGPGGIPLYSGGSGERSPTNPFAADPTKENFNAPFGVPYDQSSMKIPGAEGINGQGSNPLSGILQALMGNRASTS